MARKFKMADIHAAKVIAQADVEISNDSHPTEHMFGCGLEGFEPVVVSLEALASFLRYQCAQFDGGWDQEEYDNMVWVAKRRFLIEDR